jgi:hypothetical protein
MQLMFYCHKKRGMENLTLEPTMNGWYLLYGHYTGQCDPSGRPYLQRYIRQQNSVLPAAFPDALEELWWAIQNNRLRRQDIQERLNQFSTWLNTYQENPAVKLSEFSS